MIPRMYVRNLASRSAKHVGFCNQGHSVGQPRCPTLQEVTSAEGGEGERTRGEPRLLAPGRGSLTSSQTLTPPLRRLLQDVAIKILRNVQDDSQQYQEFLQVQAP